jgi:hypothetical protein
MTEQLKPKLTIEDEVKHFIFNWHEFPLDYWWRKRYNIPFGSRQHREMNFIDVYVEYQEGLLLREYNDNYEAEQSEMEDEMLGLKSDKEIVKLTADEIDEDYDNLDLTLFDKK